MSTDHQRCPRCGRITRAAARFCGSCGQRLEPPPQIAAAPLAVGDAIGPDGRYRVERPLGQGGFGAAFLARDTRLDRDCVVKQLAFDPAWDAETRRLAALSFRREARLLVSLNAPGHPNIPEIYDYVEGRAALVMKHIAGRSLEQVIDAAGGRLPLEQALRYARDTCAALVYMHGRAPEPVLHRDVKPANILLDGTGRIWLIDFGLAKALAAPREAGAALPANTDTSQLAGTLGYTPPEQWRGRAEPRSDVYALAASLHRMLTGYAPDRSQVLALISGALAPPPLRQLDPDAPAELERLLSRALAAEPAARPDATELLAALDDMLARPQVPPPPEPARPPLIADFVGRAAELAAFSEQLERNHLAMIVGLAGVGKTALAATLARQFSDPNKIFWHSFREGEGAEVITWGLAAFLAHHGQDELWRLLQSAQKTGGQPPPPAVLFDYLVPMLRGQSYLICLDDAHHIDGDPLLAAFLRRLRGEAQSGEAVLIVSARSLPHITHNDPPLTGLSRADAVGLLARRGVALGEELAAQLYERTEGNAQLITLAIERLSQGGDPARLIARLADSEHVERYLLGAVDGGLSEEERAVMRAVAVLDGAPASRDAIEAIIDDVARRPLADLSARHLLLAHEGEAGRAYTQHAMLRAFYDAQLSRRERRELNRRAAGFYEGEERDALRAARHYGRADEPERAARLAVSDIWAAAGAGQARPLCALIDELAPRPLPHPLGPELAIARGELASFLGEDALARQKFQAAIAALAEHARDPAGRAAEARACLGMAASLEHGAPQEALGWVRSGLEHVGAGEPRLAAALQIKAATLLISLGRYDEAGAALAAGQGLLPPGPSQLRVRALLTRGTLHSLRGEVEQGMACMQQGLTICEQLSDYIRMGELLSNLGNDRLNLGDWAGALEDFARARDLAARTGSRRLQIIVDANLGFLHLRAGDDALAEERLAECIALCQEAGLATVELSAQCTLADLMLRRGDLAAALAALSAADSLAAQTSARSAMPEIGRLHAEASLAAGQPAAALRAAEAAAALAREQGLDMDEGCALRVAGQALAALGRTAEAGARLSAAVATLDAADPYEAARARAAWSAALALADPARARELRQAAHATFARLGARRELAASPV